MWLAGEQQVLLDGVVALVGGDERVPEERVARRPSGADDGARSASPSERFVTMFPAGVMRRMRLSSPSATRMLPLVDRSSPSTRWNRAAVAGPLSPREASSVTSSPVPATIGRLDLRRRCGGREQDEREQNYGNPEHRPILTLRSRCVGRIR